MINEETLILYFYNDGLSSAEREQVQRALEQQEELRVQYAQLCESMGQIGIPDDISAPAGATASWHQALDARINKEHGPRGIFQGSIQRRFALAASAAFVFVAGWWFGGELGRESTPDLPDLVVEVNQQGTPHNGPVVPKVPVVFVRGVSTHLERAQIQLASLDLGDDIERVALIDQIVAQNRSLLHVADKNGANDVARLLRAFEPLLLEMMSEEQPRVAQERAREQLEFELGVTLTKFSRQASNRTNEF